MNDSFTAPLPVAFAANGNFPEFETQMRGYSRQQVDEYIQQFQRAYMTLAEEFRKLQDRTRKEPGQPAKVSKRVEEILSLADQEAEQKLAEAAAEAETVRREATAESARLKRTASAEAQRLRQEMEIEAERILTSAQERASSILQKAQETAESRVLSAQTEAVRATAHATAQAERTLSSAREVADRMLAEATARATELDRHTSLRVEQLETGRDQAVRMLSTIRASVSELLDRELLARPLDESLPAGSASRSSFSIAGPAETAFLQHPVLGPVPEPNGEERERHTAAPAAKEALAQHSGGN